MHSLQAELHEALDDLIAILAAPTSRVYWGFLLSAALLAFVVLARRHGPRTALRSMFSARLWFHASSRMDQRLLVTNLLLKAFLLSTLTVSSIAVAGALISLVGVHSLVHWPSWLIVSLYTLVLFVALDASRFVLHRLMHRMPLLWRFHQVHHSAEVLTPLTVYRVHPVESVLYALRGSLTVGVVAGSFYVFFGGQAVVLEIMGVHAVGLILNAAGANLRHSHVWLSYGPRLEGFLLSPAQHQMHHEKAPASDACNFGAFLSCWDRLTNTLRVAQRRPREFGLQESVLNHDPHSVTSSLVEPFRGMITAAELRQSMVPAALTVAASVNLQCGEGQTMGTPDATPIDFDRGALLQNLGSGVIVPTYKAALADAQTLKSDIDGWCEVLGGASETAALDAARSSFRAAMASWQEAELMIIGPASTDGLALRDWIYSWPVVNSCAVDQDVILIRAGGYDITTRLANRRGLDALEYTLFNESIESTCPPQSKPAEWDALTSEELKMARCDFAQAAAADLVVQEQLLVDTWTNDFLMKLVTPGSGESPYTTERDALNEVFEGMFYLDKKTKDVKLAQPLGLLTNSCGTIEAACADDLESGFAGLSHQNILSNLNAFEHLYTGSGFDEADGVGYDDFWQAAGGTEQDTALRVSIDEAQAALEELGDSSLRATLETDYSKVLEIHSRISAITDVLKGPLPEELDLDIPGIADGDTD